MTTAITVEAAELMEILQWTKNREIEEVLEDEEKGEKLEDELADVLIFCFRLANVLDLNISEIMSKKIEKNENKYPVDEVKGNFKKYTELEEETDEQRR